ncbi:hypothetical protein CsSME_00005246 [Camellia sinensis var. sinensis]
MLSVEVFLKCFVILMVLQQRLVRDFYKILNQVSTEEIPEDLKLPKSFNQLISEMKNKKYNAKDFALMLKGMVCDVPQRNGFLSFLFSSFFFFVLVIPALSFILHLVALGGIQLDIPTTNLIPTYVG